MKMSVRKKYKQYLVDAQANVPRETKRRHRRLLELGKCKHHDNTLTQYPQRGVL